MPLTPKQEMFVQEYLKDLNATQAAIRAGYSEHTAQEQGSRLLSNAMVKTLVEQGLKRVTDKAEVTAVWVRERLRENVLRSMQAEPVIDAEGNETGLYRYAGNVANRALELLGKDQGMFTDRLEVSLSGESRTILESLTKLAIDCCDPAKRSHLVEGINALRAKLATAHVAPTPSLPDP